jgi:16S rRNA G1207 methylase RsmC
MAPQPSERYCSGNRGFRALRSPSHPCAMSALIDLLERNTELLGDVSTIYGLPTRADVLEAAERFPKIGVVVDELAAHVAGRTRHAPWPDGAGRPGGICVVLPKGRQRLALIAAAASAAAGQGRPLFALGENRLGGRSAATVLGGVWDGVEKVDSARHCTMFSGVARGGSFEARSLVTKYRVPFASNHVEVHVLPGVFSADGLDDATAMLLGVLAPLAPVERVLDLGCGAGVLAACLASAAPQSTVVAADASAAALWCTRETCAALPNVSVVASDAYSGIEGQFDRIVTNPPFHEGSAVNLNDALAFVENAPRFLRPGGDLLVVANRFLRYLDPIRATFERVEVVAEDSRFCVYRARNPRWR